MPKIQFESVTKRFGDSTVIDGFDAEVPDQEFLVLLGPSGCGKSTMLRMIAGLTDITEGTLRFDDVVVNDLEPRDRRIAFVFQSYALYPHMTVRANIAFPLLMDRFRWYHHLPVLNRVMRRRFLRDPAVRELVENTAAMMELTEHLDRRPRTLSGGQRQRVAVARALVREPAIYLLDEPLSNLDAKLRTQMRAEISALYQRVRTSFVYVTHDQVEAMTMGTRIIVLDRGVVQQYGTPKEIYDRPANTFVARFIGSPPMNLIPGTVAGGELRTPGGALPADGPPGEVLAGVRAEKVRVTADGDGLRGRVVVVEDHGAETVIAFTLGEATELYYARMPGDAALPPGSDCRVSLDLTGMSWFDPATGGRVAAPAAVGGG
jgi:multiple sugar transport system ATP-binding protein